MSDRSEKGSMDIWRRLLATNDRGEIVGGGFGGMAGTFIGYPFDTLRIRLQQSSNPTKSAVGLFRHIIATEGVSALYRGMFTPTLATFFQNGLIFGTQAVLCQDRQSDKSVLIAGFGAGVVQSFVLSPAELVKIRLQLQQQTTGGANNHHGNNHRQNEVGIAKYILRREGIRGIYRGLTITVLRDAPAFSLYFWVYENVGELLDPGFRRNQQHHDYKAIALAGGLAGVGSWIICCPFDVVKTRLQAQTQSPWDHPPPKYLGIWDCFRKSVQEEGFRVLRRGLETASFRAFLVNGATFAAYEFCKEYFFPNNSHMH